MSFFMMDRGTLENFLLIVKAQDGGFVHTWEQTSDVKPIPAGRDQQGIPRCGFVGGKLDGIGSRGHNL
jgi:hypothetical protein